MRTVKLWQACALAVGLDPDKLREHPQAWMAGTGAGSSILVDDRCFPNNRLRDKFGKVLRLACSAVSYMDGPIHPQGTPHPNHSSRKDVLLPEVVQFLSGAGVDGLPIELAASQLAKTLVVKSVDLQPLTYMLTVREAQDQLRAKTGQEWPLDRVIGAGAKLAVWLEATAEHPELFTAFPSGFAAPIIEGGDLQRLAFTRDSGTLSITEHPTLGLIRMSPPASFEANAVRVSQKSLEALAGLHEPPKQVTTSEVGAIWDGWKLLDEIAVLLSKAERPDEPYPQVLSIQRRWHDNIAAAVAAGELNIFDAGFIQGRKVRADEMPRALNWCRVSLTALDKWLADMGSIYRLQAPPEQPEQEAQAATHGAVEPEPMQRSRAQESAILDAIRGAGQVPKSLPKNSSGRPGVKAEIRTQVTKEYPGLFPANSTVFDKAWDRLRSFGDIADREG
jgi:hypothetical protein